jgi:hypothetical protein
MPRGGKREGAGRPNGTTGIKKKPASKSKEVVVLREAVAEELRDRMQAVAAQPLRAKEVIQKNMAFFDGAAEAFLKKAEEAHKQGPENQAVALDFFAEHARYRLMAQKCAVDLIPYEEPRLSSTVPADPPDENGEDAREISEGDRLAHLGPRYLKHPNVVNAEYTEVEAD